jgi:hypothetical protein
MIRQMLLLVSLAASSAQAATPSYDDVARIVYADSKAVFAGMHADAYIPHASLVETIGEFMGIPGEHEPIEFGHYAMIDGCRPHSCTEKAAIVVDMRSRTVAAVALRNYACRELVPGARDVAGVPRDARQRATVQCNKEPMLDIYVVQRSRNPAGLQDEREQLARLRQWGSKVGHQGERVEILVR